MIDLHLHTTASDGELSPYELVKMASQAGVHTIAITDHDTVSGIDEGIRAGKEFGVKIIPGIEISAAHKNNDKEIHIVGLFVDHKNEEFLNSLKALSLYRKNRNYDLIVRFKELGIEFDMDILFINNNKNLSNIGKPDFARALYQQKITKNIDEAYGKYFHERKGIAHINKKRLSINDSINLIHKAGGLAILAHPFHIVRDFDALSIIVEEIVDEGLDGIEVFYNNYDRKKIKNLKCIAKRFGLLKSGGSDLHYIKGPHKAKIGFYGVKKNIPETILDEMIR